MTTLLEQELAYNHEHYPGFLEEFLGIMDQGKVHGMDITRCFYGYLGRGNSLEAQRKSHEARIALHESMSEIERALFDVRPGDTPTSSTIGGQALRDFKRAIESVLASSTVPLV